MGELVKEGRESRWMGAVLPGLICAAYIGWMLSLPLFPTQDGPNHLYYVHVMQALLSGRATPYAAYYTIKHLLPPYSLYYYSLILLGKALPMLLADKLIVCGYIVSFVFGFRYLARAIGPGADGMTLLASLLVLNWPLGMGFINFCLSLSFALWAMGMWVRFEGRPGTAIRAAFVGVAFAMMLAHPVPLLLLLAFAGGRMAIRLGRHRLGGGSGALPTHFVADGVSLLLAASLVLYIKRFAKAGVLQQSKAATTAGHWPKLVDLIKLPSLLSLNGPGGRVYAAMILGLLALAFVLAALQWKGRAERASQPGAVGGGWLLLAAGFLVLLPLIPHDLNGSHFFSERLGIIAWLLALLAASTYQPPQGQARRFALCVAALAILGNGLILYLANKAVRPIAEDIATIERTPVRHSGEVGTAMQDADMGVIDRRALTYNPYQGTLLYYFTHNDAVMYNTPWLDLEIIPLGPKGALATRPLSSGILESPMALEYDLLAFPAERKTVLGESSFTIFNSGNGGDESSPMQRLDPDGAWACQKDAVPWYLVCSREGR